MPIDIRKAVETETDRLLRIFNAARINVGCFTGQADLQTFLASVEGEEIHVAEIDGEVVGFVSVWTADRFIHHLYVTPAQQSQGVGSALLDACAVKYGQPLSLKCNVGNHLAQRFYRNRGWSPIESGEGEDGPWNLFQSPGT